MQPKTKSFCNDCDKETNHEILFTYNEHIIYEDTDNIKQTSDTDYMIVKCLGCDYVSFLSSIKLSELVDENGDLIPISFTYPEKDDFETMRDFWNTKT